MIIIQIILINFIFFNNLFSVQTEVLDQLGFTAAHASGYTGQGVTILVIDEPVFAKHPALQGNAKALTKPVLRTDALKVHGTAVTSAIIGKDKKNKLNGGAPDAYVYVISPQDFLSTTINSLPTNVSIVSMSSKFPYGMNNSKQEKFAAKLSKYLTKNNAVFVVAAGNRGRSMFDRRDNTMDQGIIFYNVFNSFPKIREKTIFVVNAGEKNKKPNENEINKINSIKKTFTKNSSSSEEFLQDSETIIGSFFLSIFGENNTYNKNNILNMTKFDELLSKLINVTISEKHRSILKKISKNVYGKAIKSDEDLYKTSENVEVLLRKDVKSKISNNKTYYLGKKTNTPGELFNDISISAPGIDIMAAHVELNSGKLEFTSKLNSGTSIAAPLVSAALALMIQKDPDLTAEEAIAILLESSNETNNPLFFGRGVLNVKSALGLE